MKDAIARPASVPALILCAALTAATAEAAWAGEEPVALFPGAAVVNEAVIDAAETAAGSGTGAGTAGGVETPRAESMAGARDAPAGTDSPAGGSRLLKALSEADAPGVAVSQGEAPGAAPLFAAEGCPRALLHRLLAGAAGEADALSALAIEQEILTLCRERQEIVSTLLETEAQLRELREAGRAPEPESPVPAASAAPVPDAEAARVVPAIETAAASPLRAALAASESAEQAPRAPRYGWFSIIGSSGALRAGVTDGSGVWFVREGDALPGGARIAAIAGRPPAVRVRDEAEGGEATPLPFRALPGGDR